VEIRYNLTDGAVQARDGATGTVAKNITNAQSSWFVNAATGDHHLAVLPPPPSIKPQPTTALPQIMTPKLGGAPDIGPDEFSLASQAPEAPTNVRVTHNCWFSVAVTLTPPALVGDIGVRKTKVIFSRVTRRPLGS
jgi:hypothetical protein